MNLALPKTLFLDANIFFAAVASSKGGSYFILELAKQRKIWVSTSAHALAEAERNILAKLGHRALSKHRTNLLDILPHMQPIQDTGKDKWMEKMALDYLPEKDVPILIAAMNSQATHLVTLDRKHFLDNQDIKDVTEEYMKICTPGDFLKGYLADPKSFLN